jgi:hypothetical protein
MKLKVDYLNDIEGARKLALWHARPWTFRLEYRYNVLRALVLRQITWKSCWIALEHSYRIVVLPMKAPHQGMLIVCPEFADEFFPGSVEARSHGHEGAAEDDDRRC